MDILVTVTRENTRVFPMHNHAVWEVMLYTAGTGALKTDAGDFSFHADTVIAVPPRLRHGSCAENAFVNICVHAPLPLGEERVRVIERADGKIRALFELIRDCYFEGGETAGVLPPLVMALSQLIACSESEKNDGVRALHDRLIAEFYRADLNVAALIEQTGYADDYLRTLFLRRYGRTPRVLLEETRMNYAQSLLDTYRGALSVAEKARQCGYRDALYFSRRFKKYAGLSPEQYIKTQKRGEHT